jgi:lysozyme
VILNQAAVDLVKEFEGLELEAYPDPATKNDPVKKGEPWTIGYGHTSMAGPPSVKRGMVITQAEAEAILKRDLAKFAQGVAAAITAPVSENQFGAVVSFAFNVGMGNLKSSTLLRKLNARDYAGAAAEFPKWNKANKKVMAGLTRRRAAERTLFLKK